MRFENALKTQNRFNDFSWYTR